MRRAAAILPLALLSTPARAFELEHTRDGAPLVWRDLPVAYDVAGAELSPPSRRALDTWAGVPGLPLLARYAGIVGTASIGDGRSTIALLARWSPGFGDAARTVAHTALRYDTRTGVMMEADLLLNGERFRFAPGTPGAFDPESVVLHESGHLLGLAHACGDPGTRFPSCFSLPDPAILEAVMAPTLSASTERRALTRDDEDGIRAVYAATSTPAADRPAIDRAERACAGSTLLVMGRALPRSPAVELREASGAHRELPVREASDTRIVADLGDAPLPAEVDLIVRAPGAYASEVGAAIARAPCADAGTTTSTTPEETGCACAASHVRGAGPGWLSLAILGALALLLGAERPAHAYKCSRTGVDSGPSLVWSTRNIPWVLDARVTADIADRATVVAEVKQSFDTWTAVDCSDLTLTYMGEVSAAIAEYKPGEPNLNAVTFVKDLWSQRYDPAIIAVTTNAFDLRTGEIYDSDIELNDEHFDFAKVDALCVKELGRMDLRNALTHEVGHLIGLDHPPSTARYEDATMYASAPPCEVKKQTLAEDDVAGLCAIYPAGQPTSQCYPPEGPTYLVVDRDDGYGCSTTRGATAEGAFFLLMLLVARRKLTCRG